MQQDIAIVAMVVPAGKILVEAAANYATLDHCAATTLTRQSPSAPLRQLDSELEPRGLGRWHHRVDTRVHPCATLCTQNLAELVGTRKLVELVGETIVDLVSPRFRRFQNDISPNLAAFFI